jgi:hypothetical protein
MITAEQVKQASKNWEIARKNIRDAIEENKVARTNFQIAKSEENKIAYEQTRKNHANRIDEIKKIRTEYFVLKRDFEVQNDA